MSISFKGFNEQILTFKTQGEIEKGSLVKMAESATVAPCESGDDFIGIAVHVHGGIAAVQVGGYASLSYSGSAPALGSCAISAADSAHIKAGGNKTVTVIELDETNSTAGILL